MTITDFLLARIAEDEAAASAAIRTADELAVDEGPDDGVWRLAVDWHEDPAVTGAGIHLYDEGGHTVGQARHIALHDPVRVLAECAAKRTCIDEAWVDHLQIDGEWGHGRGREYLERSNDVPAVVSALAAVYADHPDYDPTWRA